MSPMISDRIAAVRAFLVPPPQAAAGSQPAATWLRARIAGPSARYPEFAADRAAATDSALLAKVIVEVESDTGMAGVGVTSGGAAVAAIIEGHLARLILGEAVTAHERTWDRMHGATLHYGRKGLAVHAISAVDLALWDLHGRIAGQPVHELIGGRVRDTVRLYATGPRPDLAAKLGFAGAKLPLESGPYEGSDGLRRNVDNARRALDSVPEEFPLAYDCWMSLTVPYAVRLMDAVEPLGIRWIEEPLPPDDYAGLSELRRRGNPRVSLAAGEHEYTQSGFWSLLETGACGALQPDVTWCGGMTELLRIAALARACGVPLVPHGSGVYAYHFVITRPESDLAEYFCRSWDEDRLTLSQADDDYLTGEPVPRDGRLDPGDAPGFGLELNRSLPLARPFRGETWLWA